MFRWQSACERLLPCCEAKLSSGTAQGIFHCLTRALNGMGMTGLVKRMIGLGCDGCSANTGGEGDSSHCQAGFALNGGLLVLSSLS